MILIIHRLYQFSSSELCCFYPFKCKAPYFSFPYVIVNGTWRTVSYTKQFKSISFERWFFTLVLLFIKQTSLYEVLMSSKVKTLIVWMQIVAKINLLQRSGSLGGLSLIPLCEPNSSVPTWPLHHKPIHVNLTHSADGKRSTLALTGTRDCAIMNTPVLPVPQPSQWVRSLGPFE